uniref:AMP-binding domain-containing protein n=1 Tax=Caenorhabditis tropicalis TaxID=1561998 RepID=A0A1I7TZ61_9PELO
MITKLLELGVTQGNIVLVCLPNSIWYPILFLATAKIGAILSGISSESTPSEIKYCLEQSGATFVFTNKQIAKNNTLTDVVVETLPEYVRSYTEEISEIENLSVETKDIDSILLAPFSSGTTGAPKCCLLTHRNFLASTFSLKQLFLFDKLLAQSSMRTLAFLPFHHASGFWALLLCLLEGCTTVIMSEFHPMVMMDLIEKYDIDTINIVPSIANIFLKMGILQGRCSSLRTILCGSSGLTKDRCKRLLAVFPQVKHFIQGYGMTELVVLSCVTPIDDNFEHLGSCGELLPGFEAKLLEHPTGEIELLLKSDAIMKLYRNGIRNLDEDGFLHTGDVVTVKDGFFYVVDRMKDLIKLNGYQVSPTEIENVILTIPKVSEVAVVGIEDELCGQLPKAYVVLEIGADELLFRKHLEHTMREKLSAVKQLRGGVSIIKEMPKSASGKVQKNKLIMLN